MPAAQAPQPLAKPPRRERRYRRVVELGAAALLIAWLAWLVAPGPAGISAPQVEAAIEKAFEDRKQPTAADAYETIRPAVVMVRGLPEPNEGEVEGYFADSSIGTGVVIVDSGIVLTNLHVVHGAKRLSLTFSDGTESEAMVIGMRPEHDLAVLQAKTLPDDLVPATMRSTQGLEPGEPVVAVGFPFGIGPSASAGVISGLKREYVSPSGSKLGNLIQFDAAVNPGNSGGPLVTLDGEVVGVVTGLLNPTEARVFIGIGFAVPIENAAGAAGLSPF